MVGEGVEKSNLPQMGESEAEILEKLTAKMRSIERLLEALRASAAAQRLATFSPPPLIPGRFL